MNLGNYLPVFLFILVGIAVGLVPMALGKILGPSNPDPEKNFPIRMRFRCIRRRAYEI